MQDDKEKDRSETEPKTRGPRHRRFLPWTDEERNELYRRVCGPDWKPDVLGGRRQAA